MTKQEWMTRVNENSEALRNLIGSWHPGRRRPRRKQFDEVEVAGDFVQVERTYPITAPAAEHACQSIRAKIVEEDRGDPIELFNKAVAAQDVGEITTLLNEAWFGVPESTSCWNITGFGEAVDLLDDPPEEEIA